jgi:hypothetical protein
MVSSFILGVKNSRKVAAALAKMLGYASFDDLSAAFHKEDKGGAV